MFRLNQESLLGKVLIVVETSGEDTTKANRLAMELPVLSFEGLKIPFTLPPGASAWSLFRASASAPDTSFCAGILLSKFASNDEPMAFGKMTR